MRIGVVGLGPVGRRIAASAHSADIPTCWFDPDPGVRQLAGRVDSLATLASLSDIVMVAVPSTAAAAVAVKVAGLDAIPSSYLDWSSAMPGVKQTIARSVGPGYVDVALLDSVTVDLPQVCVAGPAAGAAAELLRTLGFDVLAEMPNAGDAAAIKMVRSLFMKPFEALAVEVLRIGSVLDPSGAALRSIGRSLGMDLEGLGRVLLETNRLHAERRAHELGDAIDSVPDSMARPMLAAAQEFLEGLAAEWSKPGAPDPGSDADRLLAYLNRGSEQ